MAHRFLVSVLLFYQVGEVQSCETCAEGIVEDASLLQSKRSKGPHVESDDKISYSDNKNPWAQRAKKRFNHHRHQHEKVVDDTDYRRDCNDAHEQVKDLSLKQRCPGLKSMTFAEVNAIWNEKFKKMTEKMEGKSEEKWEKALENLKRDFADSLDDMKPIIVEGSVPKQLGWTAADHWHKDELANFLGNTTWQRTIFNYPDWIVGLNSDTTLKDYISNHDSKNGIFLFASESGCREDHELKSLVDKLRGQFAPSPDWGYGPETCQAILAIDGIGSSHGFHCHDPVWNAQVEGIKQWWLLEPLYGSNIEDELGLMEWGGAPKVNDHQVFEYPNACAMLREVAPPPGALKCAMKPGEMIILPDSWMHATCGLSEFTIAAGGWLSSLSDEDNEN